MAKDNKNVYAPGELDRVRKNLGELDQKEAKRMTEKLGGEIGYERSTELEPVKKSGGLDRKSGTKIPGKRIELAFDEEEDIRQSRSKKNKKRDPSDDPSVPMKYSYFERLKMDKYAARREFEIKTSTQVLQTMFSFFKAPPDFVNPYFINTRMQEYYSKIESLTSITRNMMPRNNVKRSERMKKYAPLAYAIIDVVRQWDVEKILENLSKLKVNPGKVSVDDFSDILRAIYKPIFFLERLNMDAHIRVAYRTLYKALYIENPVEAQEKYQTNTRNALAAFTEVRNEIKFLMYPLLLKLVSAEFIPYESFFAQRKNRIMAFLNVSEKDQLDPSMLLEDKNQKDETEAEAGKDAKNPKTSGEDKKPQNADEVQTESQQEAVEALSEEEKAKREAQKMEKKAFERGIQALEMLFPKVGWERLASYPDLYPYFHEVLDLKRGFVVISPNDPLQQVYVLMRIIEEMFFGLRYVSFRPVPGADGSPEYITEVMMKTINNWHSYIQSSFEKEYIPGLTEYVRIVEGPPEERHTPYAKKVFSSLHWVKRLYYLPFYKFDSIAPPSFQKSEVTPVYSEVKKVRKILTSVAAGIERGKRAGGVGTGFCDGIENPWETYSFQVPNQISKRMDALMAGKNRNNAALIYFTLAAIVVMDNLINDEKSWAYTAGGGPLYRSENNEGTRPILGIDATIDTAKIFKESLKNREHNSEEASAPK